MQKVREARELLNNKHPLHKTLETFSGGKPTLRKARAFLKRYPVYRAPLTVAGAR